MVPLILNVFILAGLVKFLVESEQPFLCAGLYTASHVFLGLMFGQSLWYVVIFGAVILVVSTLYFWLLDKLEGSGAVWWLVFILGLPVMVFV